MKSARIDTSQDVAPMDPPHPGDASDLSDLYASVLGGRGRSKLTLAVAQKIEESLIVAGWPAGSVVGNRDTLTHQYGVGRDVLREVFRVLEARDYARALRGRHGGLEVVNPSEDQIHAILNGYAYLSMLDRREAVAALITLNSVAIRLLAVNGKANGVMIQQLFAANTQDNRFDAREFCRALIRCTGSRLLSYLSDCVLSLLNPASRLPLNAVANSLLAITKLDASSSAAHIARVLRHLIFNAESENLRHQPSHAREYSPPEDLPPGASLSQPMKVVCQLTSQISPCEWNRGYLLGNEMELAERLNIDRSVVRQAIRIMEDAETATAVEGRGHGLITRTPGIGHLSRRPCAFLFRVILRSMPKQYLRRQG
jgi:DNA-binding FadR family transcriptional regulator